MNSACLADNRYFLFHSLHSFHSILFSIFLKYRKFIWRFVFHSLPKYSSVKNMFFFFSFFVKTKFPNVTVQKIIKEIKLFGVLSILENSFYLSKLRDVCVTDSAARAKSNYYDWLRKLGTRADVLFTVFPLKVYESHWKLMSTIWNFNFHGRMKIECPCWIFETSIGCSEMCDVDERDMFFVI